MKSFKPGQSIRFTVTATLLDVLNDPPALTLTLRGPDDVRYTPTPVHDAAGQYHADAVVPTSGPSGIWAARWTASGTDPTQNALTETRFVVPPLDFA